MTKDELMHLKDLIQDKSWNTMEQKNLELAQAMPRVLAYIEELEKRLNSKEELPAAHKRFIGTHSGGPR